MRGLFDHSIRVGDAIATAAATLDESRLDEYQEPAGRSRADATLLLRHVLGISQAEIYASRERPLTYEELHKFNALIAERAKGKPVQYITENQDFFGLPFHVTPDVLIPRPETEHLVEAAIARFQDHPAPRIVDVGTGSGAIAVALAHALPRCQMTALDISAAALAVAVRNAKQNGVAERVHFLQSDLLAAVASESFDAVVSNPPYIAEPERKTLAKEVREYEPSQALFAGPTGFEIYERLIKEARQVLTPGGWLLMEIGQGQRNTIATMLQNWNAVEFFNDLRRIPRVVAARLE